MPAGVIIPWMDKNIYEMDEKELEVFVARKEKVVTDLSHERPGSYEYGFEVSILEDAKQLLDQKRKKPKPS
jgi:hypothetical protein